MSDIENYNQTPSDSGKPIIVKSSQLSLHPVLGDSKNFHFNDKTYQLNFSQKVINAFSKMIVIPVLIRKSNKKIKDYHVVGNIAEFAILEAAGLPEFHVSVLDIELDESELTIANLFQPLIIKRDQLSTLYLAAKQENIYRELESKENNLGFFVTNGREKFMDINGFSRQGAHKTVASLEPSNEEIEFLKCLNLKFPKTSTAEIATANLEQESGNID